MQTHPAAQTVGHLARAASQVLRLRVFILGQSKPISDELEEPLALTSRGSIPGLTNTIARLTVARRIDARIVSHAGRVGDRRGRSLFLLLLALGRRALHRRSLIAEHCQDNVR